MKFEQHIVEPLQNVDELRALMPVTDNGLYLDHAAAGVLPMPTVEAMTNRIHSAALYGVRHWSLWQKLVQRTRTLVADLIGGHADEVAFVPNTAAYPALNGRRRTSSSWSARKRMAPPGCGRSRSAKPNLVNSTRLGSARDRSG